MKVIRKDVTEGKAEEFRFDVVGSKFLVKNFTTVPMIVRVGESDKVGIMIPAETAQVIMVREEPRYEDMTGTLYVVANETMVNGCEIQLLAY